MNKEPEINVEKHIAYWRDGALECWKDVTPSMNGDRISLALFSTHLAVEKALKAHVVKKTRNFPPMIHNLISLAKIAGLNLTSQQVDLFSELNPLNIEARYPGAVTQRPTKRQAKLIVQHTKVVLEWLIKEL
jgi:HEPN domain-containing protein